MEIGCGSGQATAGFLDVKSSHTGIDVSPELLNLAKRKFRSRPQFSFLQSKFENYEEKESSLDLIYSAQAFHWIEFQTGISKCQRLLKKGGILGLFWNSSPFFDSRIREPLDEIYRVYFKDSRSQAELEDNKEKVFTDRILKIKELGLFAKAELMSFTHNVNYTTDEYLGLLKTHSDHSTLPANTLNEMISGVREIFTANDDAAQAEYKTRLILCEK